MNVIDINVATRSRIIENHVFHEKELRNNKSNINWEKEEKLKKTMVKIIQQL